MSELFGGATANALKGVLDEILEEERQMPKWFKPKVARMSAAAYELQMQHYPHQWLAPPSSVPVTPGYVQLLQKAFNDLLCVSPAPVAKKPAVCTCGGKFAGGTHSHWCDIYEG